MIRRRERNSVEENERLIGKPTKRWDVALEESLTQELRSVIDTELNETFQRKLRTQPGDLRYEDKCTILIGLALRLTEKEITAVINKQRAEIGLKPFSEKGIYYYRKQYGELIDQIYTTCVLRIGEIYKFADKFYRISRYNELADVLRQTVISDFDTEINDMSIKKANLYIKVLDRLNTEMGNVSLKDMVRRLPKEELEEDNPEAAISLSKDDVKLLFDEIIKDRYSTQLPIPISRKIEFTDYLNCANGEKMSDNTVLCWNDKMTGDKAGSQCPVQAGSVQKCPKFLNRVLLDNPEWLMETKRQHTSIKHVAGLVGCTEYDTDIRDRVAYFMKKHDIIGRIPNPEKNYHEDESSDESPSEVSETFESTDS